MLIFNSVIVAVWSLASTAWTQIVSQRVHGGGFHGTVPRPARVYLNGNFSTTVNAPRRREHKKVG
jgi:hypothetical protein